MKSCFSSCESTQPQAHTYNYIPENYIGGNFQTLFNSEIENMLFTLGK